MLIVWRGQSIVSDAARIPGSGEGEDGESSQDRYWDPRSRTSFRFDHLSLVRLPAPVTASHHTETQLPSRNRRIRSLTSPMPSRSPSGMTISLCTGTSH